MKVKVEISKGLISDSRHSGTYFGLEDGGVYDVIERIGDTYILKGNPEVLDEVHISARYCKPYIPYKIDIPEELFEL